MSLLVAAPKRREDVRSEAASRLVAGPDGRRAVVYASDALSVLYELASSPDTAGDALALLHELQVHQIELDLQAEELRETRVDLETALRRQIELHDALPVGCFTVDRGGVLCELNLTGAKMLGIDAATGAGLVLEEFFDPDCRSVLRRLIAQAGDVATVAPLAFRFASGVGGTGTISIHARREPAGESVLLVAAPMGSAQGMEMPQGNLQ